MHEHTCNSTTPLRPPCPAFHQPQLIKNTHKKKDKFHVHHKMDSTIELWIHTLHQPNTNFTKIEIDRKIDVTHLRRYDASLALVKLKMYTRYFHEDHKNPTRSRLVFAVFEHYSIRVWSFLFVQRGKQSSGVGIWLCSPNFHSSQTWIIFPKREDKVDLGQNSLIIHHLWSFSGLTEYILLSYPPSLGLYSTP